MISDYELLQPDWLWLIPFVFLFLFLMPWLKKYGWLRKGEQAITATSVRHPQAMDYQAEDVHLKNHSFFLLLICSSLFLLALAQPVRPGTPVKTSVASADILLLIDTSISMVMKDYVLDGQRVDRMTMTQVLLDRFSRRFSGKRMGIVLVGDQAQILLPPSEDKALLRYMIHQLKPTVSGRQAAIGDAIAVAADYIHTELALSNDRSAETIMVLISSADAPAGQLSPIAGVERAIEAGVILHTITIGSAEMQDSRIGELIFEPADVGLMQQLAEKTGGRNFHAIDVNSMDLALRSIEQRHQSIPDDEYAPRRYQALYYWPLLAALLLLMVNTVLPAGTRKMSPTYGKGEDVV